MKSIEKLKQVSLDGNNPNYTSGSTDDEIQELDAVIVGAGFAGVYQLKRLRDAGYTVKLVESGGDYGGVWYWNRYPGARVDSAVPHYEFSDPALWEDWTWTQRFPGSAELRDYFAYVADKWDLRKDTKFDSFVEAAIWDEEQAKWTVRTREGERFKTRFLLLNTGIAAKRYTPNWKGIDEFKGKCSAPDLRFSDTDQKIGTFIHPSYWPHKDPDLAGKKIAIIGTGSTGVQLATELSKIAGHLTLFQRTPNLAIPMKQVDYELPEQALAKSLYPSLFSHRVDYFSGFSFGFLSRATFDDTPEERIKTYESLWAEGDFKFWLATYRDMLFDEGANREAYNFWRDKTRARIQDSKIADILAPMQQPHAFGCKRISLENGYFEIFNSPHVSLVDTSATPIVEITETGIKTVEKIREFDHIICATGFDAVTGGLAQIDIKGSCGESLSEHWKGGAKTYLGLCIAGFPNLFFTYGPHGPTALCNGPTCAELQGGWILDAMDYMKEKGLKRMEAKVESEVKWKEKVWDLANASLLPSTKSVSA